MEGTGNYATFLPVTSQVTSYDVVFFSSRKIAFRQIRRNVSVQKIKTAELLVKRQFLNNASFQQMRVSTKANVQEMRRTRNEMERKILNLNLRAGLA